MATDDFYWLWLNRDDDALRDADALFPILQRLTQSFLPAPVTLEATGARDTATTSWTDAKVLSAVQKQKESIGFKAPGIQAAFSLTASRVSITLMFRVGASPTDICTLFLDLCALASPTYARCALNNDGQTLYDNHYSHQRRTFYASGLYWLNFFGPDEQARQGGTALANVTHATVATMSNGLFIQVGDSALHALTEAGHAQLLAATNSMPPLSASADPVSAPTESSTNDDSERVAALIVHVDGISGFRDADQRFWITKHIDPSRVLSASFLRGVAALPGKGSPPISTVRVLFSTEAAALANQAALGESGGEAWFVSLTDGKPRRA